VSIKGLDNVTSEQRLQTEGVTNTAKVITGRRHRHSNSSYKLSKPLVDRDTLISKHFP